MEESFATLFYILKANLSLLNQTITKTDIPSKILKKEIISHLA